MIENNIDSFETQMIEHSKELKRLGMQIFSLQGKLNVETFLFSTVSQEEVVVEIQNSKYARISHSDIEIFMQETDSYFSYGDDWSLWKINLSSTGGIRLSIPITGRAIRFFGK